jgi:TPR repeat protein
LLSSLGIPNAQLLRANALGIDGAHACAFRLLVKAARNGLPAACDRLGQVYLFGHGVPPSLSAALRWLTQAAKADEVSAQLLLAVLALQGVSQVTQPGLFATLTGYPPDYSTALRWAEQAAANGSAKAKALLGHILTTGPSELRDIRRGDICYRDSAAAGCAQGQLGWALAILRRNEADAANEARGFLESAAQAGLPAAHYVLGVITEAGVGGAADPTVAIEHYRLAAEAGQPAAQLRYGIALLAGRGVKPDAFQGESWLRRAGLAGEVEAAALLGDLYSRHEKLPPNNVEAQTWFRLAAAAGHSGAARALGHLLLGSPGVPRDPEEAAHWLRVAIAGGDLRAWDDLAGLAMAGEVREVYRRDTYRWFLEQARSGNLVAVFNVGLCLAEGIGASRDDARALACFELVAQSLPAAQYWCGRLHAEGRGCPPDPKIAYAWYLKAAAQGHADAQLLAGEMLLSGRGGVMDPDGAIALFTRAAAAGHPGGKLALEMLNRRQREIQANKA